METKKLSSLQLELLKVYAFEPTAAELLEIRTLLARYFSDKLTRKVKQAADKHQLTEQDLDRWLNE